MGDTDNYCVFIVTPIEEGVNHRFTLVLENVGINELSYSDFDGYAEGSFLL